jgi:hypothetical protein
MLVECGDMQEVQSNGSRGVVARLELFQHALASWVVITPPKRDDPIYVSERLVVVSAAKRLRSAAVLMLSGRVVGKPDSGSFRGGRFS